MKTVFQLLVLTLLIISCKEDISSENQLLRLENVTNFNVSLNRWGTLKETNGNSYVYTASTQSWTGYRTTTIIRIANDEITQRSYEQYFFNEDGEKSITDSYSETGSQIGTNSKGAAARTIDEVYAYGQNILLSINPDHNTVYFEIDDLGLIGLVGYSPNNCIDDCFEGIRIQSIEWTN